MTTLAWAQDFTRHVLTGHTYLGRKVGDLHICEATADRYRPCPCNVVLAWGPAAKVVYREPQP